MTPATKHRPKRRDPSTVGAVSHTRDHVTESGPLPARGTPVYGDEDAAWIIACEKYRTAKRRPFMLATDYLAVAKALGYRLPTPDSKGAKKS